MRALPAYRRALVLLVSSFMLTLQVAGAHLHLCFDGQAPRVQFHVVDGPTGAPAVRAGGPHVDEVVVLSADRYVRDFSSLLDVPPALPLAFARTIAPAPVVADTVDWAPSALPGLSHHHLLPPPRGPPLTTPA